MAECASMSCVLCENLDMLVNIPPRTLRNANMYWMIMILFLVSLDTSAFPLGLSTAKPPTPVIELMTMLG